ncbi:hypothetical protein CLV24_1551 [Pontibacter ummariensis]|uniref:Uncharacterized protein n=1 Tax=Pontibacter ummariensis TaxID=1610492 RepID=A0A239LXP2_9BACT|nr:hypothetical protein CLV24_1551 [Pontibacter ummariensis]SNT34638.1 hypothetical protein SAMN06296052_1551 [Pontibacter ummariensis]
MEGLRKKNQPVSLLLQKLAVVSGQVVAITVKRNEYLRKRGDFYLSFTHLNPTCSMLLSSVLFMRADALKPEQ